MLNVDQWLLDKLDCFTTKLQRRGYLLTAIHVHLSGFNLACVLGYPYLKYGFDRPYYLGFIGLIWGIYFLGTSRWAARNQDYPESVKVMERLNSEALVWRDSNRIWRWLMVFSIILCIPMTTLEIMEGSYHHAILDILSSAMPALIWYLNACMFIGPGEFAKETKNKHVHNAITLRG